MFWRQQPKAGPERQGHHVRVQRASVSLPRWPVLLACHVLSELHGRPTSKTFPHPEARLIFWDCQQSTTLARLAAAAAAAGRRTGRRARKPAAAAEGTDPASWSTIAGLLLITPQHCICAARRLSCRSLPRPRSCHGALFFSPATRPGVQEGFAILFPSRPHHRICIQPPARPVEDADISSSCYIVPSTTVLAFARTLSRRPLIEHHPTAANNKPGPTVQTIARPSSILHHFIPIPPSASNCRALNLTRQPTQLCQSQPRRPRRFSCIAPRTTVSVRELFFWAQIHLQTPNVKFELR